MTEQTETERNEAIKTIEYFKELEYNIPNKLERSLDLAISALRAQSDAERKIEKVREYCKDKMKVQFETEYSEGYVNGTNNATNEIIKILEGKDE